MQIDAPRSPSEHRATSRGDVVAWSALFVGTLTWLWLSRTVFFVGVSEWDDALYVDRAALPTAMWEIRNRYVHVWSLRLFQAVFASRQTAASLYATMSVLGIAWLAYLFVRRIAGTGLALLAAALIPLYPSFLGHLTAPMVDPPMVLWSMAGLLCAVLSIEAPTARRCLVFAVVSGACAYLAAKTKETGLAVLPAIAITLLADRRLMRARLSAWIGGVALAWAALATLDRMFLPPDLAWRPADWNVYFGASSGRSVRAGLPETVAQANPGAERARMHFVGQLLEGPFLSYTLLGVAGAIRGVRAGGPQARVYRALGTWLVCSLAFSTLVAWRHRGIQAEERYCAVMGAALVVLGVSWVGITWRGTLAGSTTRAPVWSTTLVFVAVGVVVASLVGAIVFDAGKDATRAVFFALPLVVTFLFVVPFVTSSRLLARGALVAMLLLAGTLAVDRALARIGDKRITLAPWIAFVEASDAARASIVRWQAPTDPGRIRIERRMRALSRRPASEIRVRSVERITEARRDEWLFTRGPRSEALETAGWLRVAAQDGDDDAWAVYRRRD